MPGRSSPPLPARAALPAALPAAGPSFRHRSFWLRQLHRWHWVSAATCLVGMLLFAATGITLNHAADIGARPVTTSRDATLPPALLPLLESPAGEARQPLPAPVQEWLAAALGVRTGGRDAEWSAGDLYLALPRPGGDGWVSIDRATGAVTLETTFRGWVAYLNDLHKGRDTGLAWRWFIDVFAAGCLVFCATGLLLLHLHAGGRPATWPLAGLGLLVPALLALLFIH